MRHVSSFPQWLQGTISKSHTQAQHATLWSMVPPSLLNIVKWKSHECNPWAPLLKWHNFISFLLPLYWEVPKDEMFQALTWALDLLSQGKTQLFFALAKDQFKTLDRLCEV